MAQHSAARQLLIQETRALLTRLEQVKPFALYETMVPAAALSLSAMTAIERHMAQARRQLQHLCRTFLDWLKRRAGQTAPVDEAQRRFTVLRLRFNLLLSQLDIFANVITQRSENETGTWLSGLDVVAADALALPEFYKSPAVVCYLNPSQGAAIRRSRTRLPGGGENPVAIVRIPRERMVGSSVSSSLVHEVGHQAAALLGLVNSIRPVLRGLQKMPGPQQTPWMYWERWISEIVSDLWSVGRVGVGSTLGLMGVVSLPRAFVFRVNLDDPHPFPWIRVKLSCAMGAALYPDPQWKRLADIWESYYPVEGLDTPRRQLLETLETTIPAFVSLLINHRPPSLRGQSLGEVLANPQCQPKMLRARYQAWKAGRLDLRHEPPSRAMAILGQARADGVLGPERESRMLSKLFTYWALRSTLDASDICARQAETRPMALAA
jgi:hypothetical protein